MAIVLNVTTSTPEEEERARRMHAEAVVESAARDFEHTGNPVWAWYAFKEARRTGLPIPEQILAYLDLCADNVTGLAEGAREQFSDADTAVAVAFGFKEPNKPRKGDFFQPFLGDGWRLAALVAMKMRRGAKEYLAIEAVAKEARKSRSTVRRAYKRGW